MSHEINPNATRIVINNGHKESCISGRWNAEWTSHFDMNQFKTMRRDMRTFSEQKP